MSPRLSTYLYPWDFARLGVGPVLDDLEAYGIEGVHLAANYHAISAVSPRGGDVRVFFCPRGAVFFPARAARYGRIRPAVWPDESVTGAWREVAREAERRNLVLTAWTIAMFQPWIAQDYPFAARVTAFGDRSDSGICPNSPDVQEYLAHFAVDLATQFEVRGFALEGNGIPPYDYGWVRPRVFTRLSPLAESLLRLCFCESCVHLGTERGIDVVALRARVAAALRDRGVARGREASAGVEDDDAELVSYGELASAGAEAVVRAMASALRRSEADAGVYVPAPGPDVGGRGARIEEVLGDVAGYRLFGAGTPADWPGFVAEMRSRSPHLESEVMLHPPTVPGRPVITASFDYEDPEFRAEYAAAMAAGLDWVGVYHYGLLDEERFSLTMAALGIARAHGHR